MVLFFGQISRALKTLKEDDFSPGNSRSVLFKFLRMSKNGAFPKNDNNAHARML